MHPRDRIAGSPDIAVIAVAPSYDKSLRVPLSSVDQQSRAIGERPGNWCYR